jgi:MFS family permease
VRAGYGAELPAPSHTSVSLARNASPTLRDVAHVLLRKYPKRSTVVLALMISQAFFYNAIFFTYALVLTRFFAVDATRVALFIFPFAAGNVLGPLVLGPLFDRIGRRRMIAATYALSGVTLLATGVAFVDGMLDAVTMTLAWSAVFFLASAAASSAYLTVSEVFPLEMRAVAISIFYAVGTAIGGFAAPAMFGALIATGSRANVFAGYAFGAVLVIAAAAVAWRWAVDAERKPLEEIAPPLGS